MSSSLKKIFKKIWKPISLGILSSVLLFVLYFPSVYFANNMAYKYVTAIKYEKVEHPEFLFASDQTRLFSFGARETIADLYWIGLIQYIGGNVIQADYKKYMARIVDLVTDLSPKFSYPVEVSLILLPDSNKLYETYSDDEVNSQRKSAINLGEKMMSQSCDPEKLKKIEQTSNLQDLLEKKELRNPCSNGMIPYYMGYVYYFNENNPAKSAEYYKIATTQDDAPEFARNMYAIMSGKWGERQKSIALFLSLAGNDKKENSLCSDGIKQMRDILGWWDFESAVTNPSFIQAVNKLYGQITKETLKNDANTKDNIMNNTCLSSIGKATREVNLAYIEHYDDIYFQQHQEHARDAQDLLKKKWIPYLPKDFQQDGDDNLEVIYFYNQETKAWDYKRGRYGK
jgi:hypothetical protein